MGIFDIIIMLFLHASRAVPFNFTIINNPPVFRHNTLDFCLSNCIRVWKMKMKNVE